MNDLYEDWLIEQLGQTKDRTGYSELCRILHDIPFLPVVQMDWNRNDEALNLMTERAESVHSTDDEIADALISREYQHPNGFCTMLELMLVLARRLQYELKDSEYEHGIAYWFHELIDNTGLGKFNNYIVEADWDACASEITQICGAVIFRQYGWDGEGGFFPLTFCRIDQRNQELLVQMNYYIAEHYDIC